jgi:hypothetical protein
MNRLGASSRSLIQPWSRARVSKRTETRGSTPCKVTFNTSGRLCQIESESPLSARSRLLPRTAPDKGEVGSSTPPGPINLGSFPRSRLGACGSSLLGLSIR